jgi:hypothetical protein
MKERNTLPDAGVYIQGSTLKIDFERFQTIDDSSIFELIKRDMLSGNPWASILMRQDRIHPVFDTEKEAQGLENDFYDLLEELEKADMKENQDFFTFQKTVKVHSIIEKSDEKGENIYPVVDKNQNNKIIGSVLDHSPILHATQNNPAHIRRIYVTSKSLSTAEKALEECRKRIDAREKRKKGESQ